MTKDELLAELVDEPWLLAEIADDDTDPDDIRIRFAVQQRRAVRQLRAHAQRIEMRHVRRGLLTTAFDPERESESSGLATRSGTSAPTGPNLVPVEADGKFLRAIAVPWNEDIFMISPGRRGGVVAHRERFTPDSIVGIGALFALPVLLGHDQNRSVGRVLSSKSTSRGLAVECELLESDMELEGIRRRAGGGILSHMSIAFVPNHDLDEWHRPDKETGLPLVIRKGVSVRELSAVTWPAYDGAKILGIHQKTAVAEQRRKSSDAEIAATKKLLASR